jgi:dTDP-glucose 4,6-dehydratase
MKLLVTGGAGFIGSHYVRSVLSGAWDLPAPTMVVVLDSLTYAGNLANLAEAADDPRLRFVRGDVCDAYLVDRLVAEADAVVHLAAESHVDRSIEHADDFVRTNIVGTQHLLDSARRHGVESFCHVSTDEVYGSIERGSWDERQPLAPSSPYSASKASADLLATAYYRTHGVPVRVTRGANTFGPYQHPEKLVPRFVTNLLAGQPVPLYGDGRNVRDWLHVDDHCRAIHLVLLHGRAGEVYNVGGKVELTNLDITERLLAATGQGWESVRFVADRPGHDYRYSLDSSKILREVGFEAAIDVDRALVETVAWYRQRRDWWEPLGGEPAG